MYQMSIIKYKKGSATGFTAIILLGICIIVSEVGLFFLRYIGIITVDDWLVLAFLSAFASIIGYLLYYIVARNLVMQGYQQGVGR